LTNKTNSIKNNEMQTNFLFIKKIGIYKKVPFSIVLVLSVLLILLGGYFYGLVLLGISLRFLMEEGVELDLSEKRYRQLTSWYGIKFGKWQTLPKIEYVSIFETKKRSRVRAGGGNAAHFSEVIFKLNLFYKKNKHISLLDSEDRDEILKIGDNISKILNIRFHKALKE